MAEEKYAAEATVKDDRVQTLAYKDITATKTITETVSIKPEKAGSSLIVTDTLVKPTENQLVGIKDSATLIKNDVTKPNDERAAAEILEKIADKQKEIEYNKRNRIKVKYSKSANMFSSVVLYVRPEAGSAAEIKLDRYAAVRKKHDTYLSDRFSGGVLSFSDKLRKVSAAATKELAAPVQEAKEYKDLRV
jgi:hypothetical protein